MSPYQTTMFSLGTIILIGWGLYNYWPQIKSIIPLPSTKVLAVSSTLENRLVQWAGLYEQCRTTCPEALPKLVETLPSLVDKT